MRKRVYWDYIQDIFDSIKDIEEFVKGFSSEDFESDRKTIYAVTRGIEIIGEAAKKIPKSIRDRYAEIPWKIWQG